MAHGTRSDGPAGKTVAMSNALTGIRPTQDLDETAMQFFVAGSECISGETRKRQLAALMLTRWSLLQSHVLEIDNQISSKNFGDKMTVGDLVWSREKLCKAAMIIEKQLGMVMFATTHVKNHAAQIANENALRGDRPAPGNAAPSGQTDLASLAAAHGIQ